MEKRIITGDSVNEDLLTGLEFYGELGTLIGVVEKDGNYYAILEDNNGMMFSKNVVVETNVEMTKKGPSVTEVIYAGKTNMPISENMVDFIKEGLARHNNLEFLYDGEVNVELGLSQFGNSIFVGEDNFIEHLRNLKKAHPASRLHDTLRDNPYQIEQQHSNHR